MYFPLVFIDNLRRHDKPIQAVFARLKRSSAWMLPLCQLRPALAGYGLPAFGAAKAYPLRVK
jgi:hypothetical protein